MYPNLTPTLVVLLVATLATSVFIALRRPVLRRLAFRQVSRRRREAALVVLGSLLGTAIVVGSLIVGDTLNFSVKQDAYRHLGPIDEMVTSATLTNGAAAAQRLQALRTNPAIDGVLTVHGDLAAVTNRTAGGAVAEPRTGVWDLDFARAAAFTGGVAGGSGLTGPAPSAGGVVINQELATAVRAAVATRLTFYLYGRPFAATVTRVVPADGLAGLPIDGVTRAAFFPPGTLTAAARAATQAIPVVGSAPQPRTITLISNAGDVEGGSAASPAVKRLIRTALGPLAAGTAVESIKARVLADAKTAGDSLGSMFLMIGSFAIIAGILLLVIIFVMLAEERKSELGMLRAIGMKRSRLVRTFIIEGTIYALFASLLGILVGIGVGRAVVIVASKIYSGYTAGGNGLHLVFHVTPVSLINGFAIGFLIAVATVVLTSVRISRINIIAAIRDLPTDGARRMKRRWVVASATLAAVFGALSVGAISTQESLGTYLYPSLALLFLAPVLMQFWPKRGVYTGVALATLAWCLSANSLRTHVLDNVGPGSFVVLGVVLTFAAMVLVSENQQVVAAPLRPLANRTTQAGLSTRLGLAYPLGRRFRTGSILIMYGMVVFTLVFITVLAALIDGTVNRTVASASGGFALRVDYNPAVPFPNPTRAFTTGSLAGQVQAVAPLLLDRGVATGISRSVTGPVDVVTVGATQALVDAGAFPLTESRAGVRGDRGVWDAMLIDPNVVIVDRFLGQLNGGGPPRTLFHVGSTITIANPATGRHETKTIIGILDSAFGFYGMGGGLYSPVIMSEPALRDLYGPSVGISSALIRPTPGANVSLLASRMQGRFLTHGLVATDIRQAVEDNFAANRGFFQLMQGFIALGLLVGIAGLGVMMVRAVRERRRSIGVLRALGFQAQTVQRAFLTESLFVTLEGVVIGAALSIATTYMLFKNYEMFKTAGGGFSVPWLTIGVLLVVATLASVVATIWPARQASKIEPAVAVRIAD